MLEFVTKKDCEETTLTLVPVLDNVILPEIALAGTTTVILVDDGVPVTVARTPPK